MTSRSGEQKKKRVLRPKRRVRQERIGAAKSRAKCQVPDREYPPGGNLAGLQEAQLKAKNGGVGRGVAQAFPPHGSSLFRNRPGRKGAMRESTGRVARDSGCGAGSLYQMCMSFKGAGLAGPLGGPPVGEV